jgi:hypothetical protein
MRDRYGQALAAAERLTLVDAAGLEVAVIETCPTHISFVRATAQQHGFSTWTTQTTPSTAAARPRT